MRFSSSLSLPIMHITPLMSIIVHGTRPISRPEGIVPAWQNTAVNDTETQRITYVGYLDNIFSSSLGVRLRISNRGDKSRGLGRRKFRSKSEGKAPDRPTDHATRSVTIGLLVGRIYVRSAAMRPNNRI